MKYSWIAVAVFALALASTGLVSAQDPGTVDTEAGKGDPTEKEWLEQQKQAPDETTEEAWLKEQEGKIDTEVELRPGTEGAAAQPYKPYEPPKVKKKAVRDRDPDEDIIPLKFHFHGYYRTRYNWVGNVPTPKGSDPNVSNQQFPTKNASYGYMRLRLDPEVTYGPNPDLPIARLRFTIDGLDNVVWGDNARVFSVPLFAVDQSKTDINGFDLTESLKLERAWIEFLVPIGQVRVGRMESQWGVGLLTHAGNGLAEWGDFFRGETFDRILFATRPITIARAISKGDSRQTPLIYAFVYDRLTQDPVIDSTIGAPPDATGALNQANFKPFYTVFPERSVFPNAYLTNLDRRVSEIVNVLAWFDEDYGRRESDELFVGTYVVYRWQRSTESRVTIPDVSWRLKHSLKKKRNLAITTEGEFYAILGHSGALALTENPAYGTKTPCPRSPAGPCNRGEARIYNVLARIGLMDEGNWSTQLEGGYASGDYNITSGALPPNELEPGPDCVNNGTCKPTLTTRGFNENVKVGLLMFQVAQKAVTFQALNPFNAVELGANGSVWNAKYFMPSARFTIVPGLEVHAQFLVAWAAELDPWIYGNRVTSCGFKSECFYGWEADLALRAKIGANDIVWIDLETGMMQPYRAFTDVGNPAEGTFGGGLSSDWLWTVQVRAAMVF